ncbi:MAG: PLP-dependent aminotransferase family protein [Lachnospiraceae bacterium]|nr:PLP-dependent aminotransferase family protein [Lachnospiraceae bacterium]MDY3274284.1 PLP-dependent aminotransferase family protein [Agathobacter sp.]MDY5103055.1 PLP-dependent aminotransferase family protein [Agathobacter sp.]
MLTYNMEHRDNESRYYYIYKMIKKDIQDGTLRKGEKLPSKRALAEHLGVSLITVENAYQMLKEEGYIEPRERSGYFVCEIHAFSRERVEEQKLHMLPQKAEYVRDGRLDDTAAANFPYSVYFKTIRGVITDYGEELMRRSPNEGCAILRNSIASYLLRYRGVFAQPEQIIIGSGAEHLYGTVVRLLGKDKIYGIEDPSYPQIRKVYEGTGAMCELLAMGEDGIRSEILKQTKADVLHVTPFHSYPSGVTATIGKRYEYLQWAKQNHHYIVEDDFDSEFFMPGKPVETLFMQDDSNSVIYINTFSKSLSPSIRMGYMILPKRLMKRYEETSGGFSCTVPVLEQYALAEFINKGYFEQHLRRVRRNRQN